MIKITEIPTGPAEVTDEQKRQAQENWDKLRQNGARRASRLQRSPRLLQHHLGCDKCRAWNRCGDADIAVLRDVRSIDGVLVVRDAIDWPIAVIRIG